MVVSVTLWGMCGCGRPDVGTGGTKLQRTKDRPVRQWQMGAAMFIGEYTHTIDTKGRVIIPAKFRETLGEGFYVTKGFDGCLYLYTAEGFEEFTKTIAALPLNMKDARKTQRFFLSGAAPCEFDKQGRILIPGNLRTYAGLDKDTILAGVNDHIEIWNKTKWDEANDVDEDEMDTIAEHLHEMGIQF